MSDPHYNHKAIVLGESNWKDKEKSCRDFKTLQQHNDTLVNNINSVVGENDILFCLGDWSFGNYKDNENVNCVQEFRDKLNVKTVHLILGNHDTEIRKSDSLKSNFTSVQDYLELQVTEFTKEQGVKPIKQKIAMCHYSLRTWNWMHKNEGSWMLFGHSHGSLKEVYGKSMDVGIDTHHGFKPYSYEEIKNIMLKKESIKIDHH